ncbi:MAG: glycoside hydrolase family 9 protein [Gemmatimonadaceae bacterium]
MLPILLALAADSTSFIRVNQVGYLPDAPKVAVVCSLDSARIQTFTVRDERGRVVVGPRSATVAGSFGPCAITHRLDFTTLRAPGRYTIAANGLTSPTFRIGRDVYAGGADTLLYYMRQQRSGWNPLFRDSVHRFDGNVIDDSGRVVRFAKVSGGWADASDFLQYVTTSANATYLMLAAFRDHPQAFADAFDARGVPGGNGVPDVLDEARHGLEWLTRMFPSDSEMYNQIADDRDHAYFDLMTNDTSDYGWGKGRERPVYPCTGRPQGLFQHKNRSTGFASTAGKYASAFGLGAAAFSRDSGFARLLRHKATAAYALGRRHPGVCQTAPAGAPYFYEEDNWTDDMELGAAELYALTRDRAYLEQGVEYAAAEPVTPWMGADTARHYQWFPWHNNGHFSLWRDADPGARATLVSYYRRGIEGVVSRANNGFRIGVPFIWCSNNLMTSFATQALLYRRMTGDAKFREYEQAAIDWVFGVNPWGVSMVIGYPNGGTWARDPHSSHASRLGVHVLLGGLLDGPVYRSIYQNLRGIRLAQPDEFARFNTGFIVYHDDIGDYSTNEPIMDGTANLVYLLAALGEPPAPPRR